MNQPLVRLVIENAVARVTLDRPDRRNALSREFIGEIRAAVDEAAADASVRLLVLAAEGPVFCAGMDLRQMQERAASPRATEEWEQDTREYRDLLVSLWSLSIPTLAVLQGPALAGGVGLVLACDLVLASDNVFFALPEPRRGITAAIVTPLLVYRAGFSAATYLLLSGKNVAARDALRMGLCHELAAADELSQRERELTASILGGAPSALAITKRAIALCAGDGFLAQVDAAMKISAQARETADAREGLAAFLEKRKPAWQGEGNSE